MRVLVLGGGPAGATAALQARELGADVTLVEAKRVGGTSLNQGPAPVRTLAPPLGWSVTPAPGAVRPAGRCPPGGHRRRAHQRRPGRQLRA
ncbi:MAG TPA: FAD-dependent oxidoreductase [Actinomycetes bacterium]|nr:FAD-dependent oxidoreductase [Actinomycetes bacterium]